ncbi:hypothetical protein TRFO_36797 [Tritrichomonas foetus]|uniref:Protein kinase domain-containing protein n=1 Tax=Tritrichomonas foetus TaxID=1144522 RepID=A0A1J4JD76_9EUKA|nr:hypothetical protein TRFO_36797 [Tritrichomonas foetus]|eukprot:OHS97048.1 hypothetical protein TRFO_36797 [Tritrichomonas foetus]
MLQKFAKPNLFHLIMQKIFFSEIEVLINVSNPAVLSFNMSNFENLQQPVIITNYLENGSLDNILELESRGLCPEGWTTTKKFINILGIALGMDYLHSKGIIHRDLTADNILHDSHFYPHICDFRVSKISNIDNQGSMYSKIAGTPLYMAPEVINDGKISKKGDIFAYSFILYQLITGNRNLIQGETSFKVMNHIVKGNRPDLSYVQYEEVHKLLSYLWSENPSDRKSFQEICLFFVTSLKQNKCYFDDEIDYEEAEEYLLQFNKQ